MISLVYAWLRVQRAHSVRPGALCRSTADVGLSLEKKRIISGVLDLLTFPDLLNKCQRRRLWGGRRDIQNIQILKTI